MVYFVKASLDPNNLEHLQNQAMNGIQALPDFGNIGSFTAGILFLCLIILLTMVPKCSKIPH